MCIYIYYLIVYKYNYNTHISHMSWISVFIYTTQLNISFEAHSPKCRRAKSSDGTDAKLETMSVRKGDTQLR